MVKIMKITAAAGLIATVIFTVLNILFESEALTALAITSGTITYHFAVRLLVGTVIDKIFDNRFDYNKKWFCEKKFEKGLYEILRVKKWKDKMPTANPELFDLKNTDFQRIVSAMCQAEIVHEINVLVSFIPLIASIWFGSFGVFFITSLLGALYDMMFVFIQRYNRPRFLRLAERKRNR